MSGFGLMPFGTGPFGTTYSTPLAVEKAQIPSSRNIDSNGRFTQVSDASAGGYDGMGDNLQRALVLLGLGFKPGDKIVADWATKSEADIRTVLAPLSDVIQVERIVTGEVGSTNVAEIHIRDLKSNAVRIYKP